MRHGEPSGSGSRRKVVDVCGLYLAPPENAIVLCVDEKSQIQALDRTVPILPMPEGRIERTSRDYHRHGTSRLFAALDVATEQVTAALEKDLNAEIRTFIDGWNDRSHPFVRTANAKRPSSSCARP